MPTQYQILRMDMLGTPPIMKAGRPWAFDDPGEAATNAKLMTKALHEKLCVKPILNEEWRLREDHRFINGTYRPLPWVSSDWWNSDRAHVIWKDHYAHASLEKPGWIAFTKNVEDGTKDKQTLLRPGAYLNRFFEKPLLDYGINEKNLVELFMKMYGPIEVKFANTKEEVIQIYDLLHTCLYGRRWPKNIHPATVYLAGDLQIAYIGDLAAGKVSARTVVWPEKKRHSRIYGDIARMTQGMERLGYKWGAPIGARLKRIQLCPAEFEDGEPLSGCFLVPYIDKKNQQGGGHLSVRDNGDELIICAEGEPGSHHAGLPEGRSGLYVPREDEYPTFTCERCDGDKFRKVYQVFNHHPDHVDGEEPVMWCEECLDHARQCGYSGNWYSDKVPMVTVAGIQWLEYYADMYAARCEGNGDLYSKDDLIKVHFANGKIKRLSRNYITANIGTVFKSSLTGYIYPKAEQETVWDGYGDRNYCSKAELKNRAFQCDGCDTNWLLENRHQSCKDDRLFCPNCNHKIAQKLTVPISKSRKIFEEERNQQKLPLIAAE